LALAPQDVIRPTEPEIKDMPKTPSSNKLMSKASSKDLDSPSKKKTLPPLQRKASNGAPLIQDAKHMDSEPLPGTVPAAVR